MTRPQDLIERALQVSKADDCVVLGDVVTSANLRWANNTLTTNGISRSSSVTVVAIVGDSAGVVSQDGVTSDQIEDLVRAAEHAAKGSPAAEDQMPLVGPADSGGWDGPPAETEIGVFGRVSEELGNAFSRAQSAGELVFGYAEHDMNTTYVATSSGLRTRHDQPTGHLEINGKSSDMALSAWAGAATRDFTDVDVTSMTSTISRRLAWAERKIDLPPGRYETVLPPSAVADLMIYLYWSAGARDAHDGRTVFGAVGGKTRVGERMAGSGVTLRSDPAAPLTKCAPFVMAHGSSGALSVFDNGIPLEPTSWISDGTLSSLVQTRHSAELTGLATTPYIDNLILDGGPAGELDQMIAATERGILLTCLWYIREVDPQTLLLTGLTRDGVYLVENGEVMGAVNNFRFNESPVDMLRRIVDIGTSDVALPREWSDYFNRVQMPPLRIDGFNMSSVSQAS